MHKVHDIYNKMRSKLAKAKLFMGLSLLFCACSLLTSCGAEDTVSRKFACQFTFMTQNHAGNTLEVALNGFGTYTIVSASYKNGLWHIYSSPNDGTNKTEDISITVANEKQYANAMNLGANNGIIIGHTNFNGLVAYDRQCPNCIDQYGGTSYPLEWDSSNRQKVTCKKCHRTYELEYGSVSDGEKGSRLMQYVITYSANNTGTGMVIWVHN